MAVFDPVSVCNMALDRIGIGQSIEDIDGTGHLERVCKRWYSVCRDRVLAAFKWPFTTRRVALGLVREITDDDDPDREWRYAYRYPNTCIVARRIVSGINPETAGVPFELGQDDTGRLIFTDQPDAVLEMTAAYEDAGEWPDVLADAVSADLGKEIAGPLKVASDKWAKCAQLYDSAITRAQGVASQERCLAPPPVSSYIAARGTTRDPRAYPRWNG